MTMPRKPKPTAITTTAPEPVRAGDRAGLVLVMRALREGWQIPAHVMQTLPTRVLDMVENARNDRDRIRAIECLLAMQRANHDALVAADRCERLDGGGATERVELAPITLRPGGGGER